MSRLSRGRGIPPSPERIESYQVKECSAPATGIYGYVCVYEYVDTTELLSATTTTTVVSSARSCYTEMIFWIFIPSRDTRSSRLLPLERARLIYPG